jgi:HAMP domain-containing protein
VYPYAAEQAVVRGGPICTNPNVSRPTVLHSAASDIENSCSRLAATIQKLHEMNNRILGPMPTNGVVGQPERECGCKRDEIEHATRRLHQLCDELQQAVACAEEIG